MSFEIADKKKI